MWRSALPTGSRVLNGRHLRGSHQPATLLPGYCGLSKACSRLPCELTEAPSTLEFVSPSEFFFFFLLTVMLWRPVSYPVSLSCSVLFMPLSLHATSDGCFYRQYQPPAGHGGGSGTNQHDTGLENNSMRRKDPMSWVCRITLK